MVNKNKIQGKYNEVVGDLTDDKTKKYRGIAQNKLADIEGEASKLNKTDISEKSLFSLALGVILIFTGLFFVLSVKDDLC